MENEINMLILIYDLKINDCDKLINSYTDNIRKARRNGDDSFLEQDKRERDIEYAKRHAYSQAKSDIDSLLDYLPQPKESE